MLRNLHGQQIDPHTVSITQVTVTNAKQWLKNIQSKSRAPEVPYAQPAVVAGADQDVCRLVCEVHVPHRQRVRGGPVPCPAPFPDVPCLHSRSGVVRSAGGMARPRELIPVQATCDIGVGMS